MSVSILHDLFHVSEEEKRSNCSVTDHVDLYEARSVLEYVSTEWMSKLQIIQFGKG